MSNPLEGGAVPQHSRIRAAVLAVLCVAAAFTLTVAVQQLATRTYFVLFVPAVMFSTWVGGRASGMLASALTVVAAVFLLPRAEIADHFAWVIVAGLVTFGTSVLTDARRRAEAKLTARAEEELARRRDAESLSQLKTELLAQVAHELRQPLSAISTAARLLETTAPAVARQRAARIVTRQTEHLRLIVEDLLELSKMTRHQLQLRRSRIDLCEVVEESLDVISEGAEARHIHLTSSLPSCPLHVTADPTRVRQILSNLLSNAVKFNVEGGKIDVTMERTTSQVVLRVRDTGRGIAPERLSRIFDLFQTSDEDGAGLGIGLAVVKGLVEMHGGRVEARSAGPGQGSEFVVTLPAILEQSAA